LSDDLNLRAEIARIDRDHAETNKLIAEGRKLLAEQAKFVAEENKLWRGWRLAPWLAWLGLAGGVVTIVGAMLRIIGK
jgi:hypothetical protein